MCEPFEVHDASQIITHCLVDCVIKDVPRRVCRSTDGTDSLFAYWMTLSEYMNMTARYTYPHVQSSQWERGYQVIPVTDEAFHSPGLFMLALAATTSNWAFGSVYYDCVVGSLSKVQSDHKVRVAPISSLVQVGVHRNRVHRVLFVLSDQFDRDFAIPIAGVMVPITKLTSTISSADLNSVVGTGNSPTLLSSKAYNIFSSTTAAYGRSACCEAIALCSKYYDYTTVNTTLWLAAELAHFIPMPRMAGDKDHTNKTYSVLTDDSAAEDKYKIQVLNGHIGPFSFDQLMTNDTADYSDANAALRTRNYHGFSPLGVYTQATYTSGWVDTALTVFDTPKNYNDVYRVCDIDNVSRLAIWNGLVTFDTRSCILSDPNFGISYYQGAASLLSGVAAWHAVENGHDAQDLLLLSSVKSASLVERQSSAAVIAERVFTTFIADPMCAATNGRLQLHYGSQRMHISTVYPEKDFDAAAAKLPVLDACDLRYLRGYFLPAWFALACADKFNSRPKLVPNPSRMVMRPGAVRRVMTHMFNKNVPPWSMPMYLCNTEAAQMRISQQLTFVNGISVVSVGWDTYSWTHGLNEVRNDTTFTLRGLVVPLAESNSVNQCNIRSICFDTQGRVEPDDFGYGNGQVSGQMSLDGNFATWNSNPIVMRYPDPPFDWSAFLAAAFDVAVETASPFIPPTFNPLLVKTFQMGVPYIMEMISGLTRSQNMDENND